MQKGLGITALVIAIIVIFVPFAGSWLTILVALLAAFAAGEGFGLGIAAIFINVVHIFVFFSSALGHARVSLRRCGTTRSGSGFHALDIDRLPSRGTCYIGAS
jgi:hypothetical protein